MQSVWENKRRSVYRASLRLIVLAVGVFSIAGCGDDDDGGTPATGTPTRTPTVTPTSTPSPLPGAIILPPLAEGGLLNPNAISADGSTVVGYGANADGKLEAFRWTSQEGTVALGFLPGYADGSDAASVSGDGSKIVGISISEASQSGSAWYWTAGGGMQAIQMPVEVLGSNAIQITEDGKYVLGAYTQPSGETDGFIWSEGASTQTILGSSSIPPNKFTPAGITADGLTIFFNNDSPTASPPGGTVFQYGRPFGQGDLAGYSLAPQNAGYVFFVASGAVSRDGGTVAGFVGRDSFKTPGLWLADAGVLDLAPGPPATTECVSPDGSMAGGGNGDEGTAFIWSRQVGQKNLIVHLQVLDDEFGTHYRSVFATTGGPADVRGIAADNKRLVGTAGQVALNDFWYAFLLDLP